MTTLNFTKYLDKTAIIITTFKNDDSEFDVVDFMPRV